MKRFHLLVVLCASVLMSSGCNGPTQPASEPAPQKITEAAPASAAINEPANEPTAVTITVATSGAGDKSAASEIAPKKSKRVAAFDMKRFHVARTLELPYYSDYIRKFAFAPDGKIVAGVGGGWGGRCIVFLFDATTGILLKRLVASNYDEGFDDFVWSPDGKFIAAWFSEPVNKSKTLCV